MHGASNLAEAQRTLGDWIFHFKSKWGHVLDARGKAGR